MRTTLSIDDDIAALLEREVRRTGKPFKVVVNQLLSLGLAHARQPHAAPRFKVKARPLGLPQRGNYDDVSGVLEDMEGPEHR